MVEIPICPPYSTYYQAGLRFASPPAAPVPSGLGRRVQCMDNGPVMQQQTGTSRYG
ncbi:hypothetical protein SXCC_02489 [Gluconacetobacter sp. SXCC-1]|nr:hypothetical protein SXCC_02489 [Gluconacetobacter sp. SXCC-1]